MSLIFASSQPLSKRTQWIEQLFGDRRVSWRYAVGLFSTIAILKGIRFPDEWANTAAQISYRHGFVKRGLLGEVYSLVGIHSRGALAAASLVEMGLFLAVFGVLIYRSQLEEKIGDYSVVAMLTSSYVLTFIAHLAGFTDIILATMTIGLLLVRKSMHRFYSGLVVTTIALLTHEGFLLLFLPVVLFSFIVEAVVEQDSKATNTSVRYAILLAIFAVAVCLVVVIGWRLSAAQVDTFHREIFSSADFAPREEFFDVLKVSTLDNLREGSHRLITVRWYGALLLGVCLLAPSLIAVLHFGKRLVYAQIGLLTQQRVRVLTVAALFASLAPEAMNFLGIDSIRWHVWTAFAAYLCFIILSTKLSRSNKLSLSPAEVRFIFCVIALNLACGFGLYDHMSVRPYPFFPSLFVAS